jgi:hypothetical protein
MASVNSLPDLRNRNVPIQSEGIVPKDELVHTHILSKRISKKKIEELVIQKYGTCGQGILFSLTEYVNLTDISITQNVLLRFYKLYYLAK